MSATQVSLLIVVFGGIIAFLLYLNSQGIHPDNDYLCVCGYTANGELKPPELVVIDEQLDINASDRSLCPHPRNPDNNLFCN